MINIDFLPNFEKDDEALVKKILGGYEDLLSSKRVFELLRNYFPSSEFLFFNSARSALYFLLSSLKKVSEKRTVITQAFSCLVVPEAIIFARLKPLYVDIDPSFNLDLEDLKNKLTNDVLMIIIQNTFGLPAKMKEIIEIAKENNILVLENLTHTLGAKYEGKYLGNFGDFALLSFNRNKVISSLYGGCLVINNPFYREILLEEYHKIPEMSSFEFKKSLIGGLILIYGKKFYHFSLTKVLLRLARELGLSLEMVSQKEKMGEMPKGYLSKFPYELFPLLENQLKKLERFNSQRKEVASFYSRLGLKTFEINEHSEPIYLRYPLITENSQKILQNAKKQKIYLGDWYQCVLAPCVRDLSFLGYKENSCPQAEKISQKIVNLPTLISLEEAKRVFEVIKNFI